MSKTAERRKAVFDMVAALSDDEKQALLEKAGAVLTIDGHALSPRNTMLLLLQRPSTTTVGGFNQWLSIGRRVKKGESGMVMLFPIHAGGGEEGEDDKVRFGSATVFDIAQTEEQKEA